MATVIQEPRPREYRNFNGRLVEKSLDERQQRLIDDKINARYQISAILTGVIVFGLTTMALSVVFVIMAELF